MIISFIGMAPLMMMSERKGAQSQFLRLSAILIAAALFLLAFVDNRFMSPIALLIFFVGFNFTEATLPSLLSRKAPVALRGTSMGFFATGQFIGAAVGGMLGGFLFSEMQIGPIIALGIIAQVIWILSLFVIRSVQKTDATVA
jgi:predicted MFS family arabinose efflux permease